MPNQSNPVPQAAILARVSSDEQVLGHSLDTQVKDCLERARRDGFEVVAAHIYREEGYSGTKATERPVFLRMIDDAKAGKFSRLYVLKWDRMSRNLADAVVYKQLLRRDHGIELVSLKEPIDDPDSPAGYLLEGVTDLIAGWYSKDLSQKARRARRHRFELGLHNNAVPFGYQVNPESTTARPLPAVLVPAEADAVRYLFTKYASGSATISQLAIELNTLGFTTRNTRSKVTCGSCNGRFRLDDLESDVCPSCGAAGVQPEPWKDGKQGRPGSLPWSKDSVRDLLSNPFYLGLVSYRGETGPGLHEAVVDRETFDRVQALKRTRRGTPNSWSPSFRTYLLRGLIRCVICGERMRCEHAAARPKGPRSKAKKYAYSYYRDPARLRGTQGCAGGSVRVEVVDEQVDRLMRQVVAVEAEGLREHIEERARQDPASQNRELQLEDLGRRKRMLWLGLYEGAISEAEYRRRKLELEGLESQLAGTSSQREAGAASYIGQLGRLWDVMDTTGRREALVIMAEGVFVNPQTGRLAGILPRPEFRRVFELIEKGLLEGQAMGYDVGDPEGREGTRHRSNVDRGVQHLHELSQAIALEEYIAQLRTWGAYAVASEEEAPGAAG